MADTDKSAVLKIGADGTQAKEEFASVGAAGQQMGEKVSQSAEKGGKTLEGLASKAKSAADKIKESSDKAGDGLEKMSKKGEKASESLTRAERSAVSSLERMQAALSSTSKSGYLEKIFELRGIDATKPKIAELLNSLKQAEAAQVALKASTDATAASSINASASIGKTYNGLVEGTKAYNAALRQVPAQITDIVVGLQGGQAPMTVLLQQGGQLRDVFGSVGGAARALGSTVAGLLTPFTAVAATIGVLVYGYSQGSKEADEFRKSLIETGGASGVTAGQLVAMSAALDQLGTTQGRAAEALAVFARSGISGASSLERFTLAAIRLEDVGGAAVKETAKAFADLEKDPLNATIRLNESMNYLTASTYEQIKSLEEQGKTTEAANVAQNAYATAIENNTAGMVANLGYVESAWRGIVTASKEALDAIKGIGRTDTLEAQARRIQNMIATKREGLSEYSGTSAGEQTRKEIAALEAELSGLSKRILLQMDSAQLDAQRAKMVKDAIEWDKDGLKYAKDRVKEEREIAKVREQGFAAGKSQVEIEERIAAVREKYKDKKRTKRESDADGRIGAAIAKELELINLQIDGTDKLTGSERFRVETTKDITEALRKKEITEAQATERMAQLNNAVSRGVELEKALAEAKISAANIEESARSLETQQRVVENLDKQVAKEREHFEALGKTKEEVAALEAAKLEEMATSKERLATLADEIDWSGAMGDAYRKEASALRELARLKTESAGKARQLEIEKDVAKANETAAKKAYEEWKRTSDKITDTITDALMRGFESGKTFAENLRDTIVNTFKSLVIRPVIQAIVQPVAGAVLGAFGANATAGVLGDASAAISGTSILSGLKSWMTDFGGGVASQVSKLGNYLTTFSNSTMQSWGGTLMDNATQIGQYADMAGNALGYISAAINASQGKWGAAIGQAAGTAFGGPIGAAIGGAIGGWIDNAFGGGREYTVGQGITGTFGKDGFKGNSYQDWRNDGSSGFFGIGASGSSSGRNLSALDPTAANQLSMGFKAIQEAGTIMADSLGLDSQRIKNFSKSISIGLGSDAAANKKVVDDLFNTVADEIARAVAPSIDSLSASGETAAQTLARLSTSIITSNSWLSLLRQRLFQVSLSGGDAAAKLVDAFGGLDKFTASLKSFYDLYYTEAEKVANSQKAMTDALKAFGLELPTSKQGLKDLAASLDLNSESGRAAYKTLVELAPQFSETAALMQKLADETAQKLLKTFTADGKLTTALGDVSLSLAGVQDGVDVFVGGIASVNEIMLDSNSPVITFGGYIKSMSDELTGAQASADLLNSQIEDLSGASSKAVIDFQGLQTALEGLDTSVFISVIQQAFVSLGDRVGEVIDSITTERVAVREAAIGIINPTVKSKASIQAGIASINTELPSNAALLAASASLDTATKAYDTALSTKLAASASLDAANKAKTDTISYYASKNAELRALGAAYSPSGTSISFDAYAQNDNAAYNYNASTNKLNPFSFLTNNGYTNTLQQPWGNVSTTYWADIAGMKADPRYAQLTKILDGGNAALATAAQNIVKASTALATAQTNVSTTAEQKAAAELAAAQAVIDYQAALQEFAIDASKSVTKLSKLREETVKYYEAQKALAELMQNTAAGLRSTVASYRFAQLTPEAQVRSLQSQFSAAYSTALSVQGDGEMLASYGTKINDLIGPLIDKLNETGQGSLVANYLAQAESIAKLLEDSAPNTYQADSLELLGNIDTALALLDESSKSAERIITDAINAGSDKTAEGLRAVVRTLGGTPAFATGGIHTGGLRLVGENGPELEVTGPSRIFTASQTRDIFSGGSQNDAVVAEIRALRMDNENMRAEIRAIVVSSNKTAKILERVTPDGTSLQTVAA